MAAQRVLRKISICLALALGPVGPAEAGHPSDAPKGLVATLTIPKDRIVVGEPLVVRITLSNEGEQSVSTVYASRASEPSAYGYEFVNGDFFTVEYSVFESSKQVATGKVWHYRGNLFVLGGEVLPPGERVMTERVFCPLRNKGWLGPGAYQLRARLSGRSDEVHVTDKRSFEVLRPSAEEQRALGIVSPDFVSLLQGQREASSDFVDQNLAHTIAKLRHDFPAVVYRQHFEYRLFEKSGIEAYRVAGLPYVAEFPDSPYADDILLRLAEFQMYDKMRFHTPAIYDRAAAYVEQLLERYPDSPRRQEAQAWLKKIREEKPYSQMSPEERLKAIIRKAERTDPKEAAPQ